MKVTRRVLFLQFSVAGTAFLATRAQSRGIKFRFGRAIARGTQQKNYSGNTLTVEELVQCRKKTLEIEINSNDQNRGTHEIEAQRQNLEKRNIDLQFYSSTIDKYNQEEIDAYNLRVVEYEKGLSRWFLRPNL